MPDRAVVGIAGLGKSIQSHSARGNAKAVAKTKSAQTAPEVSHVVH
jgi:hypothetical protein